MLPEKLLPIVATIGCQISSNSLIRLYRENAYYYLSYGNAKLHSFLDRPAMINKMNYEHIWFKNGEIHRDNDMPAYINYECKKWYENGKLNRNRDENGQLKPAVIRKDEKCYYVNGDCLCELTHQ